MAVQHVRKVPFQSVSKVDREAQRQLSRNFDSIVSQLVPTGTVVPWAGKDGLDPPQGWALCDGSHPGQIESLFRVIGTTFGGTGITDFLTPNMSDRFPRGTHLGSEVGDIGGSATSDMPVHNHAVSVNGNNFNTGNPSANHTHAGWSGGFSANHTHGFTAGLGGGNVGLTPGGSQYNLLESGKTTGTVSSDHAHHTTTGGVSAWHTHNANHGHSVNQSNAGSGGTNNPPYTDFRFIIKT